MRRKIFFFLIVFILLFGGCIKFTPSKFNLTLLLDCSSSMEKARHFFKQDILKLGEIFVEKALKIDGGKFEILIINTGIDDINYIFKEECPESFKGIIPLSKDNWKKDFFSNLKNSIKNLPTDRGSAIWEGIFITTERLNKQEGEKILVIYSDMRQYTPGKWNFEKEVPSVQEFKKWAEKERLIPEFKDIQITICGFQPLPANTQTTKITSKNYGKLREFWTKLFKEYGINISLNQRVNI